MKKKILVVFAVLLIICTAVVLVKHCVLNNLFSSPMSNQNIEFSKEKWDTAPYDREPMLDDLQKKYNLNSMNRNQIINLLGTNGMTESEDSIRYETGGGYLGDKILKFTFDEDGNVVKYDFVN